MDNLAKDYMQRCIEGLVLIGKLRDSNEELYGALQELAHVARSYIAHMDADDIAALDRARVALASAQPAMGGRGD